MPTHAEKRHLPYTPEQLFDLVADVERYPEFLPWCIESKIVGREGNVFYADLIIGYKLFREKIWLQGFARPAQSCSCSVSARADEASVQSLAVYPDTGRRLYDRFLR
jgi:ribosome-associated toxin RatA of RatAB toxin-antitoxin module